MSRHFPLIRFAIHSFQLILKLLFGTFKSKFRHKNKLPTQFFPIRTEIKIIFNNNVSIEKSPAAKLIEILMSHDFLFIRNQFARIKLRRNSIKFASLN